MAGGEHRGKPISLFYSYSHDDEELRKRMENHLAALRWSGLIAEWHDRNIDVGDEWAKEIDRNLSSADIILLLVSASFIASKYCWSVEMKKALERHDRGEAKVVPVILRPCRWGATPFAKLQAAPTDAKPVTSWSDLDAALDNVAGKSERVVKELRSKQAAAAPASAIPAAPAASVITPAAERAKPTSANTADAAAASRTMSDFTVFRDVDATWCPEMVALPAGEFVMGSPESDKKGYADERPQHRVAIGYRFALGRYPVTFAEYDHFCPTQREKPGDHGWGRGRRPVINVSWRDARAYVEWLAEATGKPYRLPSEAEWEYACRAGTRTHYALGDAITARDANYSVSKLGKTTEVGAYPPNPWGLYDMHGNVWEWVEDVWHDSYKSAPTDGSAWTNGEGKNPLAIAGCAAAPGTTFRGSSAPPTAAGTNPRSGSTFSVSALPGRLIRTSIFTALPLGSRAKPWPVLSTVPTGDMRCSNQGSSSPAAPMPAAPITGRPSISMARSARPASLAWPWRGRATASLSNRAFIEGDVVAGYATVPDAPERGIVVRSLTDPAAARFPEAEHRPELFDFKADTSEHWEASFYRSLRDADGIILIGGGTSVMVTGHLARGFRIPLLALATCGGAARAVWEAIIPDRDLPTETEWDRMAAPVWTADSAARCVNGLCDQAVRRSQELAEQTAAAKLERWRRQFRYALVGVLALISMGVLLSAFLIDARGLLSYLALLFFGPCVAGVSGSMTRMMWSDEGASTPTLRTIALGLVAGAISAALYVVAQLAAKPDLLRITQSHPDLPVTLIYFAVVTGWIAGFTSDLVFSKLAKVDVAKTKIIS